MCQADKYFLKSQKGILVFGEKNASIPSIRLIQSIFSFLLFLIKLLKNNQPGRQFYFKNRKTILTFWINNWHWLLECISTNKKLYFGKQKSQYSTSSTFSLVIYLICPIIYFPGEVYFLLVDSSTWKINVWRTASHFSNLFFFLAEEIVQV